MARRNLRVCRWGIDVADMRWSAKALALMTEGQAVLHGTERGGGLVSWAVGFDPTWQRDIGYGVPAYCDHPECAVEIDRGLSYVCGGDAYGGEHGCGLFFCTGHLLHVARHGATVQLCERCTRGLIPYEPKADHPSWIAHKNTDPSWAAWRANHE